METYNTWHLVQVTIILGLLAGVTYYLTVGIISFVKDIIRRHNLRR